MRIPCQVAALAVLPTLLMAQQAPPAFDVASIKRNLTFDGPGPGLAAAQPGGRYLAMGATLRRLVGDAYEVYEVIGGPQWADSHRFDINASAGRDAGSAEIQQMLRRLLMDRFRLEVHTEQQEREAFALVPVRPGSLGSRLQRSDAKCAAEAEAYLPTMAMGFPPPCGDFRMSARSLTARGMTMPRLARLLERSVGRPVLDQTGTSGAYDLEVEWSSDLGLRLPPPDSAGARTLAADGVSLFTALQEQLGLRLQSTRGRVTVMVIDRAEPPSEN